MKKQLLFLSLAMICASCSESLEDRAEKEAKDYTHKNCPTPYINYERTDSCVFYRNSKTYTFYKRFSDKADNKEAIDANRQKMRQLLVDNLRSDTKAKAYKDEGFAFRYVYRSDKTGDVLLDETVTAKDYR